MLEFIVHLNGHNYGPFSVAEIIKLLENKKVELSDCVYSKNNKQWAYIGSHPELKKEIKDYLPKKPEISVERAFIYLYSENLVRGPYTKKEIANKISSKSLNPFDFVFIDGHHEWVRLKEIKDFSGVFPVIPLLSEEEMNKEQLIAKEKLIHEKTETMEIFPSLPIGDKTNIFRRPLLNLDFFTTGDTFEISNNPIWMVKKNEEEKGPFKYLDILKMIQTGQIKQESLVKKTEWPAWKMVQEIFELNTSTSKKMVDVEGVAVEKVLARRTAPRATYLASATFKIENFVFNGNCSCLSIGGCFIELNPKDIQIGLVGRLNISPGAIPHAIEAEAEIVSVSEKRPRGIGLRFKQIVTAKAPEAIEHFVAKFLANNKR